MLRYGTMRVHAGLYVSADGRYRIRRRRDEKVRGWVWDVHVISIEHSDCALLRTFRTLKVAREYVASVMRTAF